MIPLTHANPAARFAQPRPAPGPAWRPSREAYLAARFAELRPEARGELTETGLTCYGRTYLVLPCHSPAADNPGWALVHDDPGALAHYRTLFGPDGSAMQRAAKDAAA